MTKRNQDHKPHFWHDVKMTKRNQDHKKRDQPENATSWRPRRGREKDLLLYSIEELRIERCRSSARRRTTADGPRLGASSKTVRPRSTCILSNSSFWWNSTPRSIRARRPSPPGSHSQGPQGQVDAGTSGDRRGVEAASVQTCWRRDSL